MKPLLQIALDETSFVKAIQTLSTGVDTEVDIIEVGTLLLAAEGQKAVQWIRELYPEKKIVADFKMADAGKVLSGMLLDAGADYASIICAADPKTMELANAEAEARGKEMQIELYGPWTMERAKQWREVGLKQIIYHHSRDGGKPWGEEDLTTIRELCDLGYKVTVTGGLTVETISMFKGLPIFAFIAGRSLKQGDPVEEAKRFQSEISKYWGNE